jgi:hypothetical protein
MITLALYIVATAIVCYVAFYVLLIAAALLAEICSAWRDMLARRKERRAVERAVKHANTAWKRWTATYLYADMDGAK